MRKKNPKRPHKIHDIRWTSKKDKSEHLKYWKIKRKNLRPSARKF